MMGGNGEENYNTALTSSVTLAEKKAMSARKKGKSNSSYIKCMEGCFVPRRRNDAINQNGTQKIG